MSVRRALSSNTGLQQLSVLRELCTHCSRKDWQLALKLGSKRRKVYLSLGFGLTVSLAFVNQCYTD